MNKAKGLAKPESVDLFSFAFEQEVSDEHLHSALQEVVAMAKLQGNFHSFHLYGSVRNPGVALSMSTMNVLPELEQRGYLHIWNDGQCCQLYDEYKDWHDPAEIAAEYRHQAMAMIADGKTFYDLYSIYLWVSPQSPGVNEAVQAVKEQLALDLGIEHARNNRKALGQEIRLIRKQQKSVIQAIHGGDEGSYNVEGNSRFFQKTDFRNSCSVWK